MDIKGMSLAEKTVLLKALSAEVREAKSVVRVNDSGNICVPVSSGKYGTVGMSPARLIAFLDALGYEPNDAVNALCRQGDAVKAQLAADGTGKR